MKAPEPRVPERLNPFAREVLDGLKSHPASQGIVLGGGVALQHYLEFRMTVDLDAWWAGPPDEAALGLVGEVVARVAQQHGLTSRMRKWGETESYEIVDGKRKVFSFQIARRDVQLDPSLPSHWPPLLIETFRDNLGSKMNALVERGAPRDFVDVFEICRQGLATGGECWLTWAAKNPGQSAREARAKVLARLSAIEARRPLDGIELETEKRASEQLREWVKRTFCRDPGGE